MLLSLTVGISLNVLCIRFTLRTSTFEHCAMLCRPFSLPSDICTEKRFGYVRDGRTDYLTSSNENTRYREACSSSANQEIPCVLWSPEFHCFV
jgi:hypothetical protein